MKVYIIKPNKIRTLLLPDKVEGSFWIDDTDSNGIKRNLISIEAENNSWKIKSNNDVYLMKNKVMEPFAILENYKFYQIYNEVEQEEIMLFCSPIVLSYTTFDISNQIDSGITFGSDTKCTICCSFLNKQDFIIKRENDKIYISNNQSLYGLYINKVRLQTRKELKNGDFIFFGGIQFFILINVNPNSEKAIYLCFDNNNIGSLGINLLSTSLTKPFYTDFVENKEDIEFPLYDESEYFHKMPRFISKIEKLELEIDDPPGKIEEPNNSLIMTIGPMITMSLTSIVTGYTAINNVLDGKTTWESAMPSLIISGAMIASVIVWPLLAKVLEKARRRSEERRRQKKYKKYIDGKKQNIITAKKEQSAILNNNYPNIKSCEEIILNHYTSLWQRRIDDEDYLNISLGLGATPMQIDIKYPEDHFSMVEDNLKDMVSNLGTEPKILENVPIEYSLIQNFISGFIGEEQIVGEYIKRILLQLVTFQSYDDLKIIILTDIEQEYKWQVFKNLPHCFTDDKSLRFFATTNDEYKEVCYYLDRLFKERIENKEATHFNKTYLILTDSFKKIKNFDIVEDILKNKQYFGFHLIILNNKLTGLPDQCHSFIKLNRENGEWNNNLNYKNPVKFSSDLITEIDFEACIKKLANIPIELSNNEEGQLPNKLGFLEMFDVGKIEQLNAFNRWAINNPILNLQVPVGKGKNGEDISIDLHEKYHGPHGLVAGMTGSGKSEFIITYILSMAVNYHPYEVQFILIDYKGGGLAGAFENKNTGLKLPHLVGTITNLDENEIKRSLASIESELKRRQALFNKAREISKESTIDIYKYQKMFREGKLEEPVSHLFIISDEFAELKTQQPEFMEQLISTARIGRSLGVHLILATQKPSGVVDPQIWSNTRFRVCLRVQEKSDSNEVIQVPDAAFLKQTGRFYFQVGYNEVFVLGQAAWAGGSYFPQEKVKKNLDTTLNIINNIGLTIKTMDTTPEVEIKPSEGEELTNIVKYLSDIAKDKNIHCRPLWLEKISAFIKIEELKIKYNYQKENFVLNPIVGEYDIPNKQEQRLLTLPLTKEGNATIYGASGSGKENFITTLIYSCMNFYTTDEVNFYLIDFGSGALKMFQKCYIIGDILYSEDTEKLKNLYKMISQSIEERKELFSEYNGDYLSYCQKSGKSIPNIVVVINNYESYQETFSEYDEQLIGLTRECNKYGIYFVLACNTPNAMRFKLRQNFALTYCLQQNNEDDYSTILGNVHKTYPSKIFGRGIIKEKEVYEFQTALVAEKEEIPEFIKGKCLEYNKNVSKEARKIPILPEKIEYSHIHEEFIKTEQLIIGLSKENLEVVKFDFHKNYCTCISGMDINATSLIANGLINQIIAKQKNNLKVFLAEDLEIEEKYQKYYQYINSSFNEKIEGLYNEINTQYENFEKNNFNSSIFKDMKKTTIFIIGLDALKNKLNEENKNRFGELFTKAKDLNLFHFILIDSIDNIKKFEFESWFKDCVNTNSGIWIGNGINDQFTFKMNNRLDEMKEDIPYNFCFVIERGKAKYVKYLEKLELKIGG